MRLKAILIEYINWLRSLTRKIRVNAKIQLVTGVLVFLLGQLSIVLAFFLPLKVILMVGTDGVPSYLKYLVTKETKNEYITYFAILAVVFYLLFLFTEVMQSRLGGVVAGKIKARSNKINLFDRQNEFSRDVFAKVARTWGTVLMVLGGFAIGFFLEWRLFAFLSTLLVIECFWFAGYWNRLQTPGNVTKREKFLRNRGTFLNVLSALNFFASFSVLFYLFISESIESFVIGVLMILLLRQLLQRIVASINDAHYLYKHKPKIQAVFFTFSHFEQKRQHAVTALEKQLYPSQREAYLESFVSPELMSEVVGWSWLDTSENGVAVFEAETLAEVDKSYWLKIYQPNRKRDYEHSKQLLEYLNEEGCCIAPLLITHGVKGGLQYLILQSIKRQEIEPENRAGIFRSWRIKNWYLAAPKEIESMFFRSLQPMYERFTRERLEQLSIAANNQEEIEMVEAFCTKSKAISSYIKDYPHFLLNRDQSDSNYVFVGNGNFVMLNWSRVSIEPITSDITLAQIKKVYDVSDVLEGILSLRDDCGVLGGSDILKMVFLANIDKAITKANYRQGVLQLKEFLELA